MAKVNGQQSKKYLKIPQSETGREQALVAFRKAHSLLGKVVSMVESDEYCVDIMQQNLAVLGLLKSAHLKMMNNHLETCFSEAMESNSLSKKTKMIAEIETLVKMGNK